MSSFLETNEQKSGSKIKTKDRESIGAKFVSVETVDHLSKDAQDDYKDNFKKKEKYKLDFIDG